MPADAEEPLRRRQYQNPPVIEGIARLQWMLPVPWSFTTPGLLFEQLRQDYPGEPRAVAQMSAGLFSTPDEPDAEPNAGFELRAGPQRFIFTNDDGTRLVGVSPTDISVHALPPYEGWESMTARLVAAVKSTAPVLGNEARVSVVGLRYVNRIEIPADVVELGEYLTISLEYPPGYPSMITAFLDRVEMAYEGEDTKLAFTWASTEAPKGSAAFILDLDLYANRTSPVDIAEALEILQDLKVKEGRAFEGLLKDRLREQFVEIC